MSVIGVWKDDIRIDNEAAVKADAAAKIKPAGGGTDYKKLDINAEVIDLCPTKCMSWDGKKLGDLYPGMQPLHALHQRDAQGAAAGPRRGATPDRALRPQSSKGPR